MTKKPTRIRESEIDRLGRESYIQLFLASNRFTGEIEKLCREEDLAMSHYIVLWFLCRRHAPEGVPMGQVADGLLNRASDATRLADRLTKLEFLERFPSPSDRRVVLVRVTPTGKKVFLRLTRRILALHREQWKHLDLNELRDLNRLLTKALFGSEDGHLGQHPLTAGSEREEPSR